MSDIMTFFQASGSDQANLLIFKRIRPNKRHFYALDPHFQAQNHPDKESHQKPEGQV
jgi:hypothetical protein